MDEQTDRQTDSFLGGRTDGQTNWHYFLVDEQTDRQTAGQTELRNYYIDSIDDVFVIPRFVKEALQKTYFLPRKT